MRAKQVRILVAMAWLCVVVNGTCLAACLWSDYQLEKAGISIEKLLEGSGR